MRLRPRRSNVADPVQQLTDRMACHPGFVGGHRASAWLRQWVDDAMAWPAGCTHVWRGEAQQVFAWAGRRLCGPCAGIFNDPWCARCDTDAGEDIVMVRVQQGTALAVFGLCPACHRVELEEYQR